VVVYSGRWIFLFLVGGIHFETQWGGKITHRRGGG
jgi:hypothetical protein